jgi:hypothetical protein
VDTSSTQETKKLRPVFVGYPVTYDFMWIYWYLCKFGIKSPFSHSALDMKTMAMVLLGCEFRLVGKRSMPDRWKNPARKHTHVAEDDAIEQGEMFCKMLAEMHTNQEALRWGRASLEQIAKSKSAELPHYPEPS